MDTATSNLDSPSTVDCACVIHGDVYSWTYVDRLYHMLSRHISSPIRFHVYTEQERSVPAHMIKHALPNWGISGAKSSWWYKIQLFDPAAHAGPLLYFDLDTVIVNNIDWICRLPSKWFWTVRDFKYLWRSTHHSINSSIMWWDTRQFAMVWQDFQQHDLQKIVKQYRGDQDYLSHILPTAQVRFLDQERIKSWRWQCLDGGAHLNRRVRASDATTVLTANTDVLVFHGHPKPHEIQDPIVLQHWK